MQVYSYEELLNDNLDILKEIGNIGMGHASTALSQMLNMKVTMTIPEVLFMTQQAAYEFLSDCQKDSYIVRLCLQGSSKGNIFQVLSKDFAMRIINFFFSSNLEELGDLDEMGISVIQEISNITSGAYCNSLASMTGLFIDISPPMYCPDFESMKFECKNDIILINNSFFLDAGEINSHFLFIPDSDTIESILLKLTEYYGFLK